MLSAGLTIRPDRTGCWPGPAGLPVLQFPSVLRLVVVAAVAIALTWTALLLLASRLPRGVLRDLARFLPACITTVRRLRADPRVPRRAKLAVALAGLWVLSPIDLIPEFLPVIGPLDDVVVVAVALRYAARRVPREILLEAWPGDTQLLEGLLGPARHSSEDGRG
jgi:uncharacterized membrane protein YkvA (DUF1232 family)